MPCTHDPNPATDLSDWATDADRRAATDGGTEATGIDDDGRRSRTYDRRTADDGRRSDRDLDRSLPDHILPDHIHHPDRILPDHSHHPDHSHPVPDLHCADAVADDPCGPQTRQ